MSKNAHKLSKTSKLHYAKLICRLLLFIAALVLYIVNRVQNTGELFGDYQDLPWLLGFIWIVYAIEMFLRFFPASIESPGCQKQFARNYRPTGEEKPHLQSPWRTFAVVVAWVALNAVFGVLYGVGVFDAGILVLISLAYGVCDMICILFFCPFQTWFMKNRCCTDCRIYNWDFAMMFTPYVFIPHIYTWSLLGMSLLLLIRWEVTLRLHPERFADNTNECISCKNCSEKLCAHKKQLRAFIKKNKARLLLKGNEIIGSAKESIDKTIGNLWNGDKKK